MSLDSNIEPSVEEITNTEEIYNKLPSEFGETPSNYISAYRTILPEQVLFVSENGLRPEDNQMKSHNPDTEKLLESVKPPHIKVSRMKCVYAYPDIPTEENAVSPIDTGVLMEVLIDPKKAYVANAYWIADVVIVERHGIREVPLRPSTLSGAKERAGYYWESAIPYTKWLKLSQKEKDRYSYPEILINETIPLKHMRRLN